MKISDANIKIISDSRGQDTLEAELKNGDFVATASIPSGKSRGAHEAFVLKPKKAIEKFKEIGLRKILTEREFENQEEFDNFLISLDGMPDKSNLGGNLILALSLAFARLRAKSESLELFQYLGDLASPRLNPSILGGRTSLKLKLPRPIFNVINGGAHAENQLNFQEFQVIPGVEDFGIALSVGKEFYRKLQQFLEKKFGKENVVLGDEAGFSAPFKNNEEAIEILAELIAKYNYPLRIGLDAAASQFFQKKFQVSSFKFQGFYIVDDIRYSAEELKDYYLKLIEAYDILSIEDPFSEESFHDFAELSGDLGVLPHMEVPERLVITDDLTTTNLTRLKTAINKKSGNAILIKPNQIGTLTETLNVVKMAYENNWQAIISHRSGETMDDFIADLAVGVNAWGIKAGAPAKPERLAKYERILEITKKI